jgi:hypothetical protein
VYVLLQGEGLTLQTGTVPVEVIVSEQVAELQLSLAVNVYVPAPNPLTVADVPTTVPDEFFHE